MIKNAILYLLVLIGAIISMPSCVKEVNNGPDHSVIISFESASLAAGTTKQLVCQNYSANELIWTSSDSTVAAVNVTGLITAFKPGITKISVKSKVDAVSATCSITVVEAKVTDVGVGADGSVFVIGADSVSATGGYGIYKLIDNQLHKLPDCAAVRVAVSPDGVPWVVNKSHLIYRYNGNTWDVLPGTATDIGIGADGSVFIIGTKDVSPTGGYNILKWNGSNWTMMPDCAGIHIAVAPNGIPWVVNKSNIVYQYGGVYLWSPIMGVKANDIGIGANGSVFITGKDSTLASYQPPIYKFNTDSSFTKYQELSGGTSISVTPQGAPIWIDKSDMLHRP